MQCKHPEYKLVLNEPRSFIAECKWCCTRGKKCVTLKQAIKSLKHTPQWFM